MSTTLADHKRSSAILTMHSEVKQRFGAPTKRFGKPKACQDVISSYRFRIRPLRSDLQVLLQKRIKNINVLNKSTAGIDTAAILIVCWPFPKCKEGLHYGRNNYRGSRELICTVDIASCAVVLTTSFVDHPQSRNCRYPTEYMENGQS